MAVLKCNRFFHKKLNLQPQGGGETCKPKPKQIKIKVSIGGQKDPIHFEVDEGSSDCKSVWPRVCKEVKKHLRQYTNSNPFVFQAHGLRTIGADSVVNKQNLDLDAGEKLKEDLIDAFLEYEVQVIYELSGDEVFSEAFGSFDDCEHQKMILDSWLRFIHAEKVFGYPPSSDKKEHTDWNLFEGSVSSGLILENLPNRKLTEKQGSAITSICDAQHCDSDNAADTIKSFMTRIRNSEAVGMTAHTTSVGSVTLIFPSAMLGPLSKSIRETIEEPLDIIFPVGGGKRLGRGGGGEGELGELAMEHDDICGFNYQLFSSRAPKQEGEIATLEIPDSQDGQLLDKAFVLVRIVKNSVSQAKPHQDVAVGSYHSIFKVRCSLALSP